MQDKNNIRTDHHCRERDGWTWHTPDCTLMPLNYEDFAAPLQEPIRFNISDLIRALERLVTMEKLLLKPSELCGLLSLSRSKIYMLLADKTIPSIKIDGSIRVSVRQLQEWVEKQIEVQAKATRQ